MFLHRTKIRMLRTIFIMTLLFVTGFGCASKTNHYKQDLALEEKKSVYETVSHLRGNPQDKLMRTDWPPCHMKIIHDSYQYPVPYIPYVAYNGGLVYSKEIITAPLWALYPGSEPQDQTDHWVMRNTFNYPTLFREVWTKEHKKANYVNMEEKLLENPSKK